jgi:hypothetical protein
MDAALTVAFDTGVFISHASNDSGMSTILPVIAGWLDVVTEIREAVQGLRPGANIRLIAERRLAAFRRLQALPDWVWDTLEPIIVEEIAELHDSCATDKDLQ